MHHKGQCLIGSCFPASVIDRINQGIMLNAGFTPFQRIVNYMIHVVTLPVRHCVCTVIAQMFSITWIYSEELLDNSDSFPALLSELMQPGVNHILHKQKYLCGLNFCKGISPICQFLTVDQNYFFRRFFCTYPLTYSSNSGLSITLISFANPT